MNPRPDDYELDRPGGLVLAPVGRWLPALEKIGLGRDPISPCLPLLSPVWCTKSVQSGSSLFPPRYPTPTSPDGTLQGDLRLTLLRPGDRLQQVFTREEIHRRVRLGLPINQEEKETCLLQQKYPTGRNYEISLRPKNVR